MRKLADTFFFFQAHLMKIGLFFGSFNPIHVGHLIIANTMAHHADLEQVWFVVSPQNPFKKSKSLLHEFDRYDMVRMAIDDNPRFRATDIEFHLPRPSYTIDTLTHIQEKHPQHIFRLIIGGDNLEQFKNWKNYDKILEYYGLYVYPRPGAIKSDIELHANVQSVSAPLMDISATFVRDCIRTGKSIKYLVPDSVGEHISRKKFYL
jgi:nicotinate-nucleotide adenylyltransferase